MVSSDFGKLEVMRHFSSGADCAIAGEATAAAAAAPVAETFRKSRRFISSLLLLGAFSHVLASPPGGRCRLRQIEGFRSRGLTRKCGLRIRDKGMTALYESRISPKGRFDSSAAIRPQDQAAAITLESCSRTFSPMAR